MTIAPKNLYVMPVVILLIILVLASVYIPVFCPHKEYVESAYLLCVLSVLLFLISFNIKNIHLTPTDLLFCLYVVYLVVQVTDSEFFSSSVSLLCIQILVYICFRNLHSYKTIIIYILSYMGLAEALNGILQYGYFSNSDLIRFTVHGSFSNPGPYGCFLCITFICTAGIYLNKHSFLEKGIYFASSGIQLAAILLSDSRAAWLALSIATLYYIGIRLKSRRKRFYYIFSLLGIFLLLLVLYQHKPKSADARLFIWKVSYQMAKQSPVTGLGIHSFAANYMNYQAIELEECEDDDLKRNASNNTYAFNEFIRILIEQGLVGLSFFVMLIISTYRHKARDGIDLILRSAFTAFLVFSCFSYPLEILSLSVCFTLLLACQPHATLISFRYRLHGVPHFIIACAILSFFLYYICKSYSLHQHIQTSIGMLHRTKNMQAAKELKMLYPQFMQEKEHLLSYGKVLYLQQDTTCTEVLEQCVALNPTSETLCALGEIYRLNRKYQKAETCFRQASSMVPGYITPRYLLFCLYQTKGEKDKAVQTAHFILRMRPKVVNSLVLDIKRELRNYLKNL